MKTLCSPPSRLLLAAPSLFGSADLVTTVSPPAPPLRAGFTSGLFFQVRNNGPDAATARDSCRSRPTFRTHAACDLGDIPPGQLRGASVSFVVPSIDGTIAFSATASSNTPDPNPSNNSASVALNVSADPDLFIGLSTPPTQDLSLPFTVAVSLGNSSHTTAHDVEATIDFSCESVDVQSLPDGCSNPGSGRVVCRLDSLPPTTRCAGATASLHLLAPRVYGDGAVTFKAIVTEREHDFDPISNAATATMALYKTFYVTTTKNDGAARLRQAILDANAQCLNGEPCAIAFRIDAGIADAVEIDHHHLAASGGNGTARPDRRRHAERVFRRHESATVRRSRSPAAAPSTATACVVTNCGAEVANLAINGFLRNGISVCGPRSVGAVPAFGGGDLSSSVRRHRSDRIDRASKRPRHRHVVRRTAPISTTYAARPSSRTASSPATCTAASSDSRDG